MTDQPDDFEIERVEGVTIFRFRRKSILTDETIGWFGDCVFREAELATPPRIVVDFQNVTFISSACLCTLITLHRKVQASGGWLKIRNLSPDIAEVFRITQLDRFLDSDGGDDDEGGADVPSRIHPPTPSGHEAVALPPPAPSEPE